MAVPAVSVLMGVFNGQAELPATVSSLQGQTLEDWELVIVDDGSTDGTAAMLAKLVVREPRIVPLRQDNQGLTRSLNVALAASRAPYVARLDSGDLAEPERLARQKASLDERSDVVALGSQGLFVSPEGWPVSLGRCPLTHEQIDSKHIAGLPGQMLHATLMVRRSTLEGLGGYCTDFAVAQDYDLLLRLAEVGRLANLDEPLTRMSLSLEGISSRRRAEQVRLVALALGRARQRRGLPPLTLEPRLWVPQGPEDILEKWVRDALGSGYYTTARRYAWRLLRRRPNRWALKLLARAAFEEARSGVSRRPSAETTSRPRDIP